MQTRIARAGVFHLGVGTAWDHGVVTTWIRAERASCLIDMHSGLTRRAALAGSFGHTQAHIMRYVLV